jgi:hypothetical protein
MLQGQAVKCLILFITIVKCISSFEILAVNTKNDKVQNMTDLKSIHNRTFEVPLFQILNMTLRIHPNDLHRNKQGNSRVIGLKFQVGSANPDVANVREKTMFAASATIINDPETIRQEDLDIREY